MNDFQIHSTEAMAAVRSRGVPVDRPAGGAHRPRNISQTERTVSLIGGAVLAWAGLSRGKLSGLLLSVVGGAMLHRGWTGHCYGYDALGIDTSEQNSATAVAAQQGVKVQKSVAVNRSPDDLFAYWRKLENLPAVIPHLESVQALDDKRSRWVASGPMGMSVQWEAEIIEERKPEMISWRSLPGSEMETAGSVHFKPLGHDRGTAVVVSLKYNPPAGKIGAGLASLLGSDVGHQLEEGLRHFKSLLEAGEVPTIQGQPSG